MTSDLISAADALQRLHLTARSSLTRLVQGGAITPALKGSGIRGEQFFERADVEALAAAREKASTFTSPSVETSAASARSGDVHDADGVHPDATRVALPRVSSGAHH